MCQQSCGGSNLEIWHWQQSRWRAHADAASPCADAAGSPGADCRPADARPSPPADWNCWCWGQGLRGLTADTGSAEHPAPAPAPEPAQRWDSSAARSQSRRRSSAKIVQLLGIANQGPVDCRPGTRWSMLYCRFQKNPIQAWIFAEKNMRTYIFGTKTLVKFYYCSLFPGPQSNMFQKYIHFQKDPQ